MLNFINKFFHNNVSEKVTILNQHKKVLHHGIETNAEIMKSAIDVEVRIGVLHQVKLWLRVQHNAGNYEFIQTMALLPSNEVPQNGSLVKILLLPKNKQMVVIL